jgi:aryl-alcohol dehydrogenase-like predicted oxidoreductase
MTNLPTNDLGATGMKITRIGFGAWAIGGPDWEYGWGPQDDSESVAAIERALEQGVNWIDTAHVYGFGHSEKVVGQAIRGMDAPPFVFTKGSLIEGPAGEETSCLKRDSLRQEVEGSLRRLGVDAIDLYQIHAPFPEEDIDEGWEALREMKAEGLIRHIGVSNFSVEQMRQIGEIAPVETLQPVFSLIHRAEEKEVLPFCEAEGIGVIVYSPMGSGLLTGAMSRERVDGLPAGDWRRRSEAFQEPQLSSNLAIADKVVSVAGTLGVAPGVVATAWTLRSPAVDGAIVGFRRPAQVDDLIEAAKFELAGDEAAKLDAR